MPSPLVRLRYVRGFAGLFFIIAVLGAVCGAAIGARAWGAGNVEGGVGMIAGSLGLLALAGLAYGQLQVMIKFESNTYRLYDAILDTTELARQQTDLARTVADNSSLSEWAKKIVYREKDHEFLGDAIQASIVRQDWEAARHLIAELDEELGYADEARQLREEVERTRQTTLEEKIEAAVQRFEQLCAARKWDQARRETARLMKIFPGSERIGGLQTELGLRRQEFKRSLLKQYDEAARRNDIERATELLVELDQYLAPNEGAALKESARGVFKAKLMQMGVQFSLAVADKQYAKAIDVGERIIHEHPNSRYAHEISDMLPHLKRRAAGG